MNSERGLFAALRIFEAMNTVSNAQRVRVWDVPTRMVHWLFVLLVLASWWTAENRWMDYHRYSGYTLLGLLVFRVYWGLLGSRTARFASFVKGPSAILNYLRGQRNSSSIGHNPIGALSVIALLSLLIAQVTLGLFSVDVDGLESGPLSYMVSFDAGRAAAEAHEIVFNVLVSMIALHIAAIVFYLAIKRDNLIAPMITGTKTITTSGESIEALGWVRFIIGVIVAAALVWWII